MNVGHCVHLDVWLGGEALHAVLRVATVGFAPRRNYTWCGALSLGVMDGELCVAALWWGPPF